jgi:hypothetical protein
LANLKEYIRSTKEAFGPCPQKTYFWHFINNTL